MSRRSWPGWRGSLPGLGILGAGILGATLALAGILAPLPYRGQRALAGPGLVQSLSQPAHGPAPAPTGPPWPPGSAAGQQVDRPPSVDAALIDTVLAEYSSPAAGSGRAFYELGQRYGIDPAFALAFFVVESQCGTRGVARFTHSIGNIRCSAGYNCYEGYRAYGNWAEGLEDWYRLIRALYVDAWGLHTPAAILSRYAPFGDNNDPAAYAASVESLVAGWRQEAATR